MTLLRHFGSGCSVFESATFAQPHSWLVTEVTANSTTSGQMLAHSLKEHSFYGLRELLETQWVMMSSLCTTLLVATM
jgi:hypothetical protein